MTEYSYDIAIIESSLILHIFGFNLILEYFIIIMMVRNTIRKVQFFFFLDKLLLNIMQKSKKFPKFAKINNLIIRKLLINLKKQLQLIRKLIPNQTPQTNQKILKQKHIFQLNLLTTNTIPPKQIQHLLIQLQIPSQKINPLSLHKLQILKQHPQNLRKLFPLNIANLYHLITILILFHLKTLLQTLTKLIKFILNILNQIPIKPQQPSYLNRNNRLLSSQFEVLFLIELFDNKLPFFRFQADFLHFALQLVHMSAFQHIFFQICAHKVLRNQLRIDL